MKKSHYFIGFFWLLFLIVLPYSSLQQIFAQENSTDGSKLGPPSYEHTDQDMDLCRRLPISKIDEAFGMVHKAIKSEFIPEAGITSCTFTYKKKGIEFCINLETGSLEKHIEALKFLKIPYGKDNRIKHEHVISYYPDKESIDIIDIKLNKGLYYAIITGFRDKSYNERLIKVAQVIDSMISNQEKE